jgi:hypothetical protein
MSEGILTHRAAAWRESCSTIRGAGTRGRSPYAMPCRARFTSRSCATSASPPTPPDSLTLRSPSATLSTVPFTDWIARAPRDVLKRTKAKAVRRAAVAGATLDL